MIFSEFSLTIDQFKTHPKSGRNIWLWNGDTDDLKRLLPLDITSFLDIKSLSETASPKSKGDKDIANEINRILSEELERIRSDNKPPHILLVTGCYLLARYNTGLATLFNYHVGNGIATIMVVPIVKRKIEMPAYINYDPNFTLSYLTSLLGIENAIEVNANG